MHPFTCLALIALIQAPQDTVPPPQVDAAWSPALTTVPSETAAERVPLEVLVDRWGRVLDTRIDSSAALDAAAALGLESRARQLRFLPWEHGPAWTRISLAADGEAPMLAAAAVALPAAGTTRAPEIKNETGAARAIDRYYPAEMKRGQNRIMGTVVLSIFVDSTGAVTATHVKESSGIRELDEGAERAAFEFEFEPALEGGRPVAAWLDKTIEFVTREAKQQGIRGNRQFTLGPESHPVAEAKATVSLRAATADAPGDMFPELIEPDRAAERLHQALRAAGPEDDVGITVQMEIDAQGLVRSPRIESTRGGFDRSAGDAILAEIQRLRFRPAVISGEPQAVELTTWFVFNKDVGLVASRPIRLDRCLAPLELRSRPQASQVDQRPGLATPDWEERRLVGEIWPADLQQAGDTRQIRVLLLVDAAGRVCDTVLAPEPDDPYIAHKARQIARSLRFIPATLAGEPVAAWQQYMLAFSFEMR